MRKNYIYVEAEKEAHVMEACEGFRNIFASAKVTLDPIREMAGVLSVESKSVDLARDSWFRMKLGAYKGDLAKVVDVDNVRQRVTVKLIPRVDLHVLANKLNGSTNGHDKNITFMCADVTSPDLKIENNSIDLIFSNWLLMYLSDEENPGKPSEEFAAYIKQSGYNLHGVKAYGQMLQNAGFHDVIAEDRTEQFLSVLRKELAEG